MPSYLTGKKLKAIRALRGMTQTDLSKKSGVSQPAIAAFESGRQEMRSGTLDKLVKALDIEISYTVNGTVLS